MTDADRKRFCETVSSSAMVRGEVVDKRDGDRSGEIVTIRLDADPADLGSTSVSQTSLELGLGDEATWPRSMFPTEYPDG